MGVKIMGSIIAGYRHTGIIVRDMDDSLKFYRDILGMEVIQDFIDGTEYINEITGLKGCTAHFVKLKSEDGTVLELLEYPTHRTAPLNVSIINVGVCHIALRVHSAEGAYHHLVDKKVEVISPPVLSSEGIAKVFFCIDPDGVRIEMVEML
jgi:catechol 2,3-dioxygenase-like lactoylglutathione lyase family enzyme